MTTTTVTKEYNTSFDDATNVAPDVNVAHAQKEAERKSDPAAERNPQVNVAAPVPSSAVLQPTTGPHESKTVTETTVSR